MLLTPVSRTSGLYIEPGARCARGYDGNRFFFQAHPLGVRQEGWNSNYDTVSQSTGQPFQPLQRQDGWGPGDETALHEEGRPEVPQFQQDGGSRSPAVGQRGEALW